MKFSIDAVESLDYDFTSIPANNGKGMCKGKGTVPEPTQARLKEYSKDVKELFDGDAAGEAPADEKTDHGDRLLAATAKLCQNQPSTAELKELPPRIRNAFMKWIYQELSDPEV